MFHTCKLKCLQLLYKLFLELISVYDGLSLVTLIRPTQSFIFPIIINLNLIENYDATGLQHMKNILTVKLVYSILFYST